MLSNIPNKVFRGLSVAATEAHLYQINNEKTKFNKSHYFHGAAIYKNGDLIGVGHNTIEPLNKIYGNGNHCHAEISAIKDCFSKNKSLLSKAKSYSFLRNNKKSCEI